MVGFYRFVGIALQTHRSIDRDPVPWCLFIHLDAYDEGLSFFGNIIPIDFQRPAASFWIEDLHRPDIAGT